MQGQDARSALAALLTEISPALNGSVIAKGDVNNAKTVMLTSGTRYLS